MYLNQTSFLDLLPHNQDALDICKSAWDSGIRKTCVIHPTGTGKSFIFHRLVQDCPKARFALVVPTRRIPETQRESILRACPDFDFSNAYDIYTYAALVNDAKANRIAQNAYDYIIIDEAHRALAKTWHKGVDALLAANPDAKVLGLTATPVRYSDRGRDVSQELFDGMIASQMNIVDAILDGLLPAPDYVVGEYDPIAKLASYRKRVAKLTGARKTSAEKIMRQMKRAATTSAANIADILQSNLPKPNGKYLLFFPKISELEYAIDQLPEWFSGVNPNLHVYQVHSANRYSNTDQLRDFDADNDPCACKLLLSVDSLKEGVHPHGVDGIIMLRHTASPTVYLQQIDRAFDIATAGKTPVIIDLVDNIHDLSNVFKSLSDTHKTYGKRTPLIQMPFFHIAESALARQALYDKLDEILTPLTLDQKIELIIADLEARKVAKGGMDD